MPRRKDVSAGDWLVSAARRNPEAVLVLAAGLAMLLRKGIAGQSSARGDYEIDDGYDGFAEDEEGLRGRLEDVTGAVREGVTEAAEVAAEYAAEVGERAYETAARIGNGAYSTADMVLRQQPLAVAVLGLAAGAAVAAVLPPTEVERRTLSPARGKLADAADRAADSLKEAASEAARDVKARVVDSVIAGSGDVARDAAETFARNLRSEPGRDRTGSA